VRLLEERIRRDGVVKSDQVLKVDSFLNHQMDIGLFREMARQWHRDFADAPINKVLTVEASGIGIAAVVAEEFGVPAVFAKKSESINIDGTFYATRVRSFTHQRVYSVIVSTRFLGPDDHVLIVDDFMANGCAMDGLLQICDAAGPPSRGWGSPSRRASSRVATASVSAASALTRWRSLTRWTPRPGTSPSGTSHGQR